VKAVCPQIGLIKRKEFVNPVVLIVKNVFVTLSVLFVRKGFISLMGHVIRARNRVLNVKKHMNAAPSAMKKIIGILMETCASKSANPHANNASLLLINAPHACHIISSSPIHKHVKYAAKTASHVPTI
jgi:hypothetical protein